MEVFIIETGWSDGGISAGLLWYPTRERAEHYIKRYRLRERFDNIEIVPMTEWKPHDYSITSEVR